jgi:hypothetical protein
MTQDEETRQSRSEAMSTDRRGFIGQLLGLSLTSNIQLKPDKSKKIPALVNMPKEMMGFARPLTEKSFYISLDKLSLK